MGHVLNHVGEEFIYGLAVCGYRARTLPCQIRNLTQRAQRSKCIYPNIIFSFVLGNPSPTGVDWGRDFMGMLTFTCIYL